MKTRDRSGYTHILARNSAYASLIPQFNIYMQRVFENGLVNAWELQIYRIYYKVFATLAYLDNKPPPNIPKALNLEHLQAPFWFLIFGYILAICAFVLEKMIAFYVRLNSLINITI